MEQTLFQNSSTTYEGSCLIDRIRQTCVMFLKNPNIDDIKIFLKQSLKYLKQDLSFQQANELLSALLSCLSYNPKLFSSFFPHLFKRGKKNANYIIITTIIISEMANNYPQLSLPDYHSFIDEALTSVTSQIQKSEETPLEVYGHKISPDFKSSYIVNLLLTSTLTEKLFISYFPYLFQNNLLSVNPKFSMLIQKVSKSGTISISPQTENSNDDINNFITSKGKQSVLKMSDQAISLIESVVIFIKCQEKKKIKGLKKETILQFLAVLIIIIKNYKIHDKVKFSAKVLLDLFFEGINYFESNFSPVLVSSIDLIVSNYFYINSTLSINPEALFKMFDILLQQLNKKQYNGDKMLFIQTIFDFNDKIKYYNFRVEIMKFYEKNGYDFIQLILKNLNEVNSNFELKLKKLNLKYFNQNLFFDRMLYNSSEIYSIVYFLDKSCENISKEKLKSFSEYLWSYIYNNINENKWEKAILIIKFLKKNSLLNNDKIHQLVSIAPEVYKAELVYYRPPSNESVYSLLKTMLIDPYLDSNSFYLLFSKMAEDKELLQNYLVYLIAGNSYLHKYTCVDFFRLFNEEIINYRDSFFEVATQALVFISTEESLYFKTDFNIEKEIESKIGFGVIDYIFEFFKNNPSSFQPYLCLMCIASSFPFLFIKYSQKVFDTVLPAIEYMSLIFDRKTDEENLVFIKCAYSALQFLLSTLQASIILDMFYTWLFSNILNFSDTQVLCFFMILNLLNEDIDIKLISPTYIIKYNFLEKVSTLLGREVKEGFFMTCYKDNIYKYLTVTYKLFLKLNIYNIAIIDELMKFNSPIRYYYNSIINNYPRIHRDKANLEVISDQFNKFVTDVTDENHFWLSYNFNKNRHHQANQGEMNQYLEKFQRKSVISNDQKLEIRQPITFHMLKYLAIQKNWVYCDISHSYTISLSREMLEYYRDIVSALNVLREYADNHRLEEDEVPIDSFSIIDYLLPQYCQENLIKNLMNDASLPSLTNKCSSSLCDLFEAYASNNIALLSFLSIIQHAFCKIYRNCIGYASTSSLKVMYNLVDILCKLANLGGFKENFFEACGNSLINIIMSPEFRCDPILLWKFSVLLMKFDKLPSSAIQLIGFMIQLNNDKVTTAAVSLCSKFTKEELKDLKSIILSIFDNEIENEKRFSMITDFIYYFPSIIEERGNKVYSILKGLFKKLSIQRNDKTIDFLSMLLNKMAPKRRDDINFFSDILSEKTSQIPQNIKDTSPQFWNLVDKYLNLLIRIIDEDPNLLNKFSFLFDYPELISFKTRSRLFRTKMRAKIDNEDRFVLHINSENILSSSYQNLYDEQPQNLLKKLYVIFENSKITVDMGGPTREWFTKLAKEIFNQNYALFDCTKSISYQPSPISFIHDDFLQHFRFVGTFIARSLIEGQCIDAHLTTSFIKQILQREPDLNDLQDVDEELFNSLTWILDNDVESLDMYFEIDYEELGVHKTMPLKENGSEIKVTNENKNEFVYLNSQFALSKKIEIQVKAFCDGFYSLISHDEVKFFSPKEFDLLVCGVPDIDVNDFINNCDFEHPYTAESPVVQMFFNVIKKWDNQKLSQLLLFMTGASRVPANGLREFCEMSGFPFKIAAGGQEDSLPQAHTCFNTIDLPPYTSEEELDNKLSFAIQECNTFEMI